MKRPQRPDPRREHRPPGDVGRTAHPLGRFRSGRASSVRYALDGLRYLLRTQPNARIHLVSTVLVVTVGAACSISRIEWAMVSASIAVVWAAEALNTAIEALADEISLERRDRLGAAKDVAAFGVLATSIGAAFVGILVFGPRIWAFLQGS